MTLMTSQRVCILTLSARSLIKPPEFPAIISLPFNAVFAIGIAFASIVPPDARKRSKKDAVSRENTEQLRYVVIMEIN